MRSHNYYVYLLVNRPNGVLYCGVTNDIARRLFEHRSGAAGGFSGKYHCHRLVWFEHHTDIAMAIRREKQIKKWRRAWKVQLIEQTNPQWHDLAVTHA